jgi:hypothetical protein
VTTPQFRLAAGSGWRPGPSVEGFRNSRWDRAALPVTVNPTWLLAPLFARDAGGLTPVATVGGTLPGPIDPAVELVPLPHDVDESGAARSWPSWWAAALAYRPGTPAPLPADLIAGSPDLMSMWTALEQAFQAWMAGMPTPVPATQEGPRRVERDALSGFAARNGRDPGRWAVRILQIPVAGRYLYSADDRRIVVSAALRNDPDAYPHALAAELPRHF